MPRGNCNDQAQVTRKAFAEQFIVATCKKEALEKTVTILFTWYATSYKTADRNAPTSCNNTIQQLENNSC